MIFITGKLSTVFIRIFDILTNPIFIKDTVVGVKSKSWVTNFLYQSYCQSFKYKGDVAHISLCQRVLKIIKNLKHQNICFGSNELFYYLFEVSFVCKGENSMKYSIL